MRAPPCHLPLLALLAAAGCAHRDRPPPAPPAPGTVTLAIPGHGAVALALPAGWEARPVDGGEGDGEGDGDGDEEDVPVGVELGPPGAGFVVLLVHVGGVDGEGPRGADAARLLAELARRKAVESAVEEELPLHELPGPGGPRAYWFAATDRELTGRAPGEGEYRHVLQGVAAVGPVLLGFTLLDNGPGPQREALLELVRTARHVPEATARGAPPDAGGLARALEPDPDARTVPYVVRDAGGRVTVLVDLPGFRMFKPKRTQDGRAVAVVGQAVEGGLVVSLILREGPADARACRDRDLATLRAGTPGLSAVSTAEAGGQARLAYRVSAGADVPVEQRHAHAFLARDGTCVNLHVSAADEAELAPRVEAILASLRFGEAL